MKEKALKEILKKIINKLYDIENCGGDWNPECKDIPSVGCMDCCQGKELLADLKQLEEQL